MSDYTIDDLRALRNAGFKGDELRNKFNCGSAREFTGKCVEWRVTGIPLNMPEGCPDYDFVWHGNDAEEKARCFLAAPDIAKSFDKLKLQSRVVVCGNWTDEEFLTDDDATD